MEVRQAQQKLGPRRCIIYNPNESNDVKRILYHPTAIGCTYAVSALLIALGDGPLRWPVVGMMAACAAIYFMQAYPTPPNRSSK